MSGRPDIVRPISYPRPDGSTSMTPPEEAARMIDQTTSTTRWYIEGVRPGTPKARAFIDLVDYLILDLEEDTERITGPFSDAEIAVEKMDQEAKRDPLYNDALNDLTKIIDDTTATIGYDLQAQVQRLAQLKNELFPQPKTREN